MHDVNMATLYWCTCCLQDAKVVSMESPEEPVSLKEEATRSEIPTTAWPEQQKGKYPVKCIGTEFEVRLYFLVRLPLSSELAPNFLYYLL